jgi:dTDP-4-amino-4,6-dideoxygalactose transaminase
MPYRVQFFDPMRSSSADSSELEATMVRTLRSGWYILGPECQAFEAEFASWLGVEHCVGVASGTDAVELALRVLGVRAGDEVITQASTCVPTVSAIERSGARPVLCDAFAADGLMDPGSLEQAISARTRAIVAVHLYGQCCDMETIGDIAASAGVPVIEDCAQAHGARHGKGRAGTLGALGAFSFYPTKNLGALGDAGAVVCNDDQLADRVRSLRQYGEHERRESVTRGINSRLDELQAAILRVKLRTLEADLAQRRRIAARYREGISGEHLLPLREVHPGGHAYHLFVCHARDRTTTESRFAQQGVQTMIHYPRAVHQHPAYVALGRDRQLHGSEELARSVISLPLYPGMTDQEVELVIAAAQA